MSSPPAESRMRIGLASAGMLMSGEEFDAITRYDKRYRYELIRGVLVVSPMPLEAESDPNEELGYLLRRYRDDDPRGTILDKTLSERYIATGPDTRRRPDRVIWTGLGRVPNPAEDIPAIAVEFVSKGKRNALRDYEEKRREYLAIGITEYWVIDRFRRMMTVYRNDADGPVEQVISEQDDFRTALLPGFVLPLARLLTLADDWKKAR